MLEAGETTTHERVQTRLEAWLLLLPPPHDDADHEAAGTEAGDQGLSPLRADERPHDGAQEAPARASRRVASGPEPGQRERRQIEPARPGRDHLGDRLADGRGVLEAVPGAR